MKYYTRGKISSNKSLTNEGYLLCLNVPIARLGEMLYHTSEIPDVPADKNGIVRQRRNDDELFSEQTIASCQGKPVTINHPEDDVSPENYKELANGIMLNVRRGEGDYSNCLVADLLITTKDGIDLIQKEIMTDVSLGYNADYFQDENESNLIHQKNIIANHLAIVEDGRCGDTCSIKDAKFKFKSTRVRKMAKGNKFSDKINRLLRKASRTKDEDELENIHDEIEELVGEIPEEAEPDLWAKNESDHAEMRAAIAKCEASIANLLELIQNSTKPVADEAPAENNEMMEAMKDEFPDEVAEKAVKANDSAYFADSFADVVSKAEIIAPGINVPFFDHKAKPEQTFKKICGLRRDALVHSYRDSANKAIIDGLTGRDSLSIDGMSCKAVKTLFNAAVTFNSIGNNATFADGFPPAANAQNSSRAMSPSEINELNRKFYNR